MPLISQWAGRRRAEGVVWALARHTHLTSRLLAHDFSAFEARAEGSVVLVPFARDKYVGGRIWNEIRVVVSWLVAGQLLSAIPNMLFICHLRLDG